MHLHFVLYRNNANDTRSAISPWWLPGFYSMAKFWEPGFYVRSSMELYADDQDGNRVDGGEPGLYENRIFSAAPKK